jgi:peptide subunit release factor 1 (eRF1)
VRLSEHLLEVEMSVACSRCDMQMTHPGKWFKSVQRLKCPSCGNEMNWGYEQKLALFSRYER